MRPASAADVARRSSSQTAALVGWRFRSSVESRIMAPSDGDAMPNAVLILAVAACAAGAASAQQGQDLLRKHDCYICHADTEAKTGPAFVDIAAKYRRDPKAAAALTAVVKKGAHGSGPWHMPPMPQVPQADARRIVDHILSLTP
jgi:cytochrome c